MITRTDTVLIGKTCPASYTTVDSLTQGAVALEDLDVGDQISVSFTGEILAAYPAKITQVEAIRLLEDEL